MRITNLYIYVIALVIGALVIPGGIACPQRAAKPGSDVVVIDVKACRIAGLRLGSSVENLEKILGKPDSSSSRSTADQDYADYQYEKYNLTVVSFGGRLSMIDMSLPEMEASERGARLTQGILSGMTREQVQARLGPAAGIVGPAAGGTVVYSLKECCVAVEYNEFLGAYGIALATYQDLNSVWRNHDGVNEICEVGHDKMEVPVENP